MSRDLRELLKTMNALPVLKVSGEAMHEAFADMDGITGADQFFVDWDEQEWFVPLSSVVAAIEALLADSPSVEPAGLDVAWREAEAALDAWSGRQPGDGLHVHADVFDDALGYCADARGIRNERMAVLAERKALTPTAALRALADALLPTQASDSPEKP